MKRYTYISLATLMASCAVFKGSHKKPTTAATPVAATPVKPVAGPNKNGVKPYASVITKSLTKQEGIFTLLTSRDLDSIYFEIPDSLIGRDFMLVNRLKKAPVGAEIYPGEELDAANVYFEKGPGETLIMRSNLVAAAADTADMIHKAVISANQNPIIATLKILAYGKDSASYVVDGLKFIKEPASPVNYIRNSPLFKVSDPKTLKDIFVEKVKVYPLNITIALNKNGTTKPTLGAPAGGPVSYSTTSSLILLPKVPMQQRFNDGRVGYFGDMVVEYGDNQQRAISREFSYRWRLEPKPEDVEKYKRGELVEPIKPIVYYIDPNTPKKWRKYLIMGINDWQVAFEKAGFKNAIMAKEWPENDSTMDMDDVRYSFLNYFPSEKANAYGPNIHDLRSGEIIQTHIGWYHNVMVLVRNWYMIQCGPNDPQAQHPVFSDELMGQLIRFVSSHEVGHTLGLAHNFGSSSTVPVDSLRSISFLRQHGHTPSIMDYARFDYVAQPQDHIPQELLFPRIGDYDQWAIEWGYKQVFAPSAAEDKKIMDKEVTKRLAANPRLWWGDGETRTDDPRSQSEDLGDDAAKANTYGIENLKRVVAALPAWTKDEATLNVTMKELYKEIQQTYQRYVNHVISNVGASNYTIRPQGDPAPSFVPVPKAKQLSAVKFLNDQVFKTPTWLTDAKIVNRVEMPETKNFLSLMQSKTMSSLYSIGRLNMILSNERRFGDKAMGLSEFITAVHGGVWSDLKQPGVKTDIYRRNLQKSYVAALNNIVSSPVAGDSESDAVSMLKVDAKALNAEVKLALTKTTDPLTKAHLADISGRLDKMLSNK
ncbi:zinc-dependent metalloprotease [Chitinophaga sp. Cy-1792]|uniref:zinc-dependent metalloprotease n=1 Tax=Chitinophaga sp. Cy-1792 TaxID=2608339 RepID=UPI0014237CAC|nr:zinc-dependent metalloprotease [Chitinophaga sp. Cy-1792]NIG53560.1 zinc-dependent metalloprotease [Chitinophaga sp. Cy-1792]